MMQHPQQAVNVFPNPGVGGGGPAQGQIIEQPVPTPPVSYPPPPVVPVYPEGQVPVAQQVLL